MTTTSRQYTFGDEPGESRHGRLVQHLGDTLDPFTSRQLDAYLSEGMRCLEIGAGSGSVALFMAERGGEVTATDLDPGNIPDHPRLTAVRHDIVKDPMVAGAFDLIHTRLVLVHLAERLEVLDRLVGALAPGGRLVIDEIAAHIPPMVLRTPDPEAHRLLADYQAALLGTMRAAGSDPGWGMQVYSAMVDSGLAEVESELWSGSWSGGQAGCLLPYTMCEHRRRELADAGMSEADIDHLRSLLIDPRLVITNAPAISTVGRKH